MDESVRAEYQRRLAAGDQNGALQYLRMLRTQTNDPNERAAYDQAISGIEGPSDPTAAAIDSGYSGSVGPFGDNASTWAAEHPARAAASSEAGAADQVANDISNAYAGTAGSSSADAGASGSSGSFAPSAPAPAPAQPQHPDAVSQAADAVRSGVQHIFEGVTGHGAAHAVTGGSSGGSGGFEPHAAPPQHPDAVRQAADAVRGGVGHVFEGLTGHGQEPPATASTHHGLFGHGLSETSSDPAADRKISDEDTATQGGEPTTSRKIADEDITGRGFADTSGSGTVL